MNEIVTKDDWNTIDMPLENDSFIFKGYFDGDIVSILKKGFKPQEMEDKWFWYSIDNKLYVHRSWTGYCIYIIDLNIGDTHEVKVNRNNEQYKNTDINHEIKILNDLLYYMSRGKYKKHC